MARIDVQKLKLPLINPVLSLNLGITDEMMLWFFHKIKRIGEKEAWGPQFMETINEGLQSNRKLHFLYKKNNFPKGLEQILKLETTTESINFAERTNLMFGPLNLLTFLRRISGRIMRFEEKFDENLEESMLKSLKLELSQLSFDEILIQDFENLLKSLSGHILNVTDDPSLELTKHLLLSNKALFLWNFQQKNENNQNFNKKNEVFKILFESFREYKTFEEKYLMETLEFKKSLDFADFPRNLFQKLLFGDQKKILCSNSEEIQSLLLMMNEIDPRSNVKLLLF